MRVLAACFVLVLATASARADDVGLVVTGGGDLHDPVQRYLEHWLAQLGYQIAAAPLNDDAITTITNCLVIDDAKCARAVVDARSKTARVVYARLDPAADGGVTFRSYWFVKGKPPVGEQRACKQCDTRTWHELADQMMAALLRSVPTGRLELASDPPGLDAELDGADLGATPVTHPVLVGTHNVRIVRSGRTVGARAIAIRAGEVTRVDLAAEEPARPGGGSRVLPILLAGAGVACLGASAGFFYYGAKSGPSEKWTYPESDAAGIGLAAVGVGAVIGGLVTWRQASGSAPIAAIGPRGGYVGWITSF